MEGTMSEIRYFAADFQPKNWAYCQGQILAINTNQALFSLLGTTYGGNGQTTFALPDFRSRTPVGTGANTQGANQFDLGELTGTETVTVTIAQMPAHNHPGSCTVSIPALSEPGTSPNPSNAILASVSGLYTSNSPDTTLHNLGATPQISITGGNAPIQILQPYLAMNAIICMYGIYPSRN